MKAKSIVNELKERAAVMGIDAVALIKHGEPHQEIIALDLEWPLLLCALMERPESSGSSWEA
jgi:hypothetical protein